MAQPLSLSTFVKETDFPLATRVTYPVGGCCRMDGWALLDKTSASALLLLRREPVGGW